MTIDDRYRAQLQAAIAALRYWVPTISDAAHVTQSDGSAYWSLAAEPNAAGACPFELVLRTDGKHDIMIAGESYEDLPTDDLDMFVPLACAIARGDVIRRMTVTAATGTPVTIETIVNLDGGKVWRQTRDLPSARHPDAASEVLAEDRTFLPYKRE